jgi:uncharacterized protein YbjQ (UPF0145 family)
MQLNKSTLAALLLIAVLPSVSQARDTTLFPNFEAAVQEATNAGRLDGSVKFYLAGTKPAGKVSVIKSGVTTSKKTNAFNKSDEGACSWAMQSALIAFQNAAKAAGANAVVNLASNYKNVEYKSTENYECHAGAIMAGVAIKGDLAKVQ